MNKLISVVMPTFKRDVACITDSVNSVLDQTYDNIELVVVDDSPSDFDGRDSVRDFIQSIKSKTDRKIKYIRNATNMGGSGARNVGIFAAEGEYIAFLDDDDRYVPDKLRLQLNFMEENKLDMSFCNMIITLNGKVLEHRRYENFTSLDNEALLKYHLLHQITGTPSFMYRADKLREIGGLDDALSGQEYILMLKTITSGLKIGYLDCYGVLVSRNPGHSISYSPSKLEGEKRIYKIKSQYFSHLTSREIRYVKFRYRAVMAVGFKRNHMYGKMLASGMHAVLTSPYDVVSEIAAYMKSKKSPLESNLR